MQSERFTIKAQEALQEARRTASASGHPEIRPLHLLLALTRQDEGIVGPVLQRLGADPRAVARPASERLASTARVEATPTCGPSRSLVVDSGRCGEDRREFQDDYLSTEHLLLAMAREPGRDGGGAAALRRHRRRHPGRAARGARVRAA